MGNVRRFLLDEFFMLIIWRRKASCQMRVSADNLTIAIIV